MRFPIGKKTGIAAWVIFFALLVGLPFYRQIAPSHALEVFDSFFRVGSLVFGGGHVVLPLLQTEVVGPGWVTNEQFVAGYGAAQAVPGPLFTFSAYLGAVMSSEPNGWTGAFFALVAIFLPSFLLVIGALPFWDLLRSVPVFQSALKGINAAVVGLLLAALYNPVWTSAIYSPADFGARAGCIWPFDVLEMSALVGGCADRCRRRTDSARLSLPSTEPRRIDSAAITHVYGTGGVGVGGPYLL